MSSNTKSELSSRIVGSKLWLIWMWVSAGVVCLADIIVLVVLGLEGVQGSYYALPIVFLVLDIAITAMSAVTNFRFRRALIAPVVYAVLKLVIVILAMVLFLGDTVIFSTAAITLWIVLEFFSIVCILLSAVFAKGSGRVFLTVTAVCTVAILAFGVVYMVFVSSNGFFGQNKEKTFEKRTLIYSYYDDGEDSLVVSDVMKGNGNTVVIPAEFNGMKVKGIDCTVFAQDGVDTVVLQCDDSVEFRNTSELCYMGDDVTIYADADSIDTYRDYFYSLSLEESVNGISTYSRRSTPKSLAEAYAAFANAVCPVVEDDKVFVTIGIDYRYLSALGSEIPGVWIADRGTKFSPYDFYGFDYMEHTDEESEDDLYWCYENFSKCILTDLTDSTGKSVVGSKIDNSVTVSMNIEDVYAVAVGDGNDEKYGEPGLDRDFKESGYRYVTKNTADGIMTGVLDRTGFTLSWEYSVYDGGTRRSYTKLADNLSDRMTIYPVWTMDKPEVSAFADKYTVVYGNTVQFGAEASFADSSVALSYVWTHGSSVTAESGSFEKGNMNPTTDGGVYTVTVTAGGDEITSLTSEASASISIAVNKRGLTLNWSTTSSLTYSGNEETISVETNEGELTGDSGVINGDSVTVTLDASTMKSAGSHTFTASLDSEYANFYEITNPTKTYTIAPYSLEVTWGGTTVTYDGYTHSPTPTYSVTALGGDAIGDEFLGASVTESGPNAGEYTATITIKNTDYTIASGTTCPITIEKKEITITWDSANSFEYDGTRKGIEAKINSLAETDTDDEVYLTYSGDGGIDVESYDIYASLAGEKAGNYYLSDSGSTYTITQKSLMISAKSGLSKSYDAVAYSDEETYTYSELATTDSLNEIVTVSVSYLASGISCEYAKDAGEYTFTISIFGYGTKYSNYAVNIDNNSGSITISKAQLTLTWPNNPSFTYNGAEQYPKVTSISGTKGGETVELEYTVSGGSDASAINVGSYTVTASLPSSVINYELTGGDSCAFTITAKTLSLSWSATTLVYNGAAQHPTATPSGFEGSDTAASFELNYSVTGDDSKDVGSYTVTVSLPATGAENYALNAAQTSRDFSITQKSVSLTWTNMQVTYNGSVQVPSVSVNTSDVISGEELTYSLTYNGSETSPKNAGSYTVIATPSSSNYSFSPATQTFTIDRAEITITWQTGVNAAPTATVSGGVSGEVTWTLTYYYLDGTKVEGTPTAEGSYRAVVTLQYAAEAGADNYTVSGSTEQSFTISGDNLD